jgi:membrane carboxypeptidase/penicillin-binding protein
MIRFLRTTFYVGLIAGGLAVLGLVGLLFVVVQDLPRVPDPLGRIIETPPTEIFAVTGERLMVIGGREAIPINRVSQDFINAVIATEDHRFWGHHGVDKLRTLKALWITLFQPGKIQGASTITQQLAKNLFFSFERSYMRKFRELLVALQIESRYGKEDILEAYINQIAFGPQAHGIEQAARSFFGKTASEINLAEAAMLAGLPKSPTRYNPYRHLGRAKTRQRIVLARMVATGYITRAQADDAFQTPIVLAASTRKARTGGYFLDMVIRHLEDRYGTDAVHHGGLKVATTIDPQMQTWAEDAMDEGLESLATMTGKAPEDTAEEAQHPQGRAGGDRGQIRGCQSPGGRPRLYRNHLQSRHPEQPAGRLRVQTLYLLHRLETLGFSPDTVMVDRPMTITVRGAADWQPRNFSRTFQGPIILKKALMDSVNTIAAQLIERTGPEAVIATARRCGIQSPLRPVYSLALGTSGVSPLEMASAFATFATGGIRHEPFWILRVEDTQGRILEEHLVSGQRVLEPDLSYQIVDMMRGVLDHGSGAVVRRLGFTMPAAAKTGTTNSFKDAWFTGFTPTLSTSVWVGFDKERPLRDKNGVGITGGRGAAPIWAHFMKQAMEGEPTREFAIPEDIHMVIVDPQTGRPPDELSRETIEVALTENQTADGAIVEGQPEGILLSPGPETPASPPPTTEGIIEEDLPIND